MARRARITAEPMGDQPLAIADVADSPLSRVVGLLGRRPLRKGDGLLLKPCRAVHTCFMRYSIDVLFLDRHGYVLRRVDRLRPFRSVWGGWRAQVTIELPGGLLQRSSVQPGNRVWIEAV